MAYWIRWESADGRQGPPIGPFTDRRAAAAARLDQVRAAADALEHGTGKAGTWTADGELWCDDMFHDNEPLGRYVIEVE